MQTHLKRGIIVWILSFLTFLAALNTLYAAMHGVEKDAGDPINPYLIRYVIHDIPLHYYFWSSVAATCAFLALTSIVAFRRLPDPHLFWKIDKLEEGIADNADTIRATQTSLLMNLENNRKAWEEFVDRINTTLEDTRREMLGALEEHGKSIQQIITKLESATKEMTKRAEEVE